MIEFGKKVLIFDGAMGTMLQKSGLKLGEIPEAYNIKNPEVILNIHKSYIEAGADIITTNTFGANDFKLKKSPYSVEEIIDAGVKIAKRAAENKAYVALDIGPIGALCEPLGDLKFDDAYEIFKKEAVTGEKSGADLVIIETMTNLSELRAAILAVKENTNLKVITTMSFEETGRTFTGCLAESFAVVAEGMGVDALGVNCSLGPKELLPVVKKIKEYTSIPLIVQPNAGMPKVVEGVTTYDIDKKEFASYGEEFYKIGASILGGCCGTTPEFIFELAKKVKGKEVIKKDFKRKSCVCTATSFVNIDGVRVIGERINPTGKKLFKQALIDKNMDYVIDQALSQVESKADILDINVGLPGICEEEMMQKVIKAVSSVTDVPLQIDSVSKEVIEKALRYYNGKAIVNSVNGEDFVLESILPVVKKYGASVIGLTIGDKGIPKKAEERLEIAEKIVEKAKEYNIAKEDIFIDSLTLAVSAGQEDSKETLRALPLIKEKLGVKTVLGVSNISFGLPRRDIINRTFLAIALSKGLDLPIINPGKEDMMETVYSYNVLANNDKGADLFVKKYADSKVENTTVKDSDKGLKELVKEGIKGKVKEEINKLFETENPFDIVDKYLIPALDDVGRDYEKGKIFLPQLIRSAETVKICVDEIKEKTKTNKSISKGKIIIATVKGDVHDIGKNIVKIILENYGYEIIDLGKDVPPEKVLESVKQNNVKLVGLSALMTTTVISIEKTVNLLKKEVPHVKIMVGGAVLTKDYAEKIGADFYAKDANAAVGIAKQIFK